MTVSYRRPLPLRVKADPACRHFFNEVLLVPAKNKTTAILAYECVKCKGLDYLSVPYDATRGNV